MADKPLYNQDNTEVLSHLQTDASKGLSSSEANKRLENVKSAIKKAKIKKTIVMNPDSVVFDEESGTTVAFD